MIMLTGLDWTTVTLLPKTVSMIMAISQRVFVGEPLCRDPEWVLTPPVLLNLIF